MEKSLVELCREYDKEQHILCEDYGLLYVNNVQASSSWDEMLEIILSCAHYDNQQFWFEIKDDTYYFTEDEVNFLRSIKVNFDKETLDKFNQLYCDRYNYYRLRGANVTEDQAIQILSRTDTTVFKIVRKYAKSVDIALHYPDIYSFDNTWFWKYHNDGWCMPDGTVGGNGYISPVEVTFYSIIEELLILMKSFDFLDIVIALSDLRKNDLVDYSEQKEINDAFDDIIEASHYETELFENRADKVFSDNIFCLIRIKNNHLELYDGDEAKQLYEQYDREHHNKSNDEYHMNYENKHNESVRNIEYFKKCLLSFDSITKEDFDTCIEKYEAM